MVSQQYSPSYTHQTPSGYIFRLRIPGALQAAFGKTEFRYSLKTGSLREARQKAGCIFGLLSQLFTEVRLGGPDRSNAEKINQLVDQVIKESLANYDRFQALLDSTADGYRETHHVMLSDLDEHRALNQELLEMLRGLLGQIAGDTTLFHSQDPIAKSLGDRQAASLASPSFTEVQAIYFEEVAKSGSWTEKTKGDNVSTFKTFVRAMGDLPMSSIDRKTLAAFKAILMKLPPNMNVMPEYRDRTIQEIIDSKPGRTLSVDSINKHFRWLSGICTFAVKSGLLSFNPVTGMLIKKTRRSDMEREVYTREDLGKLFHNPEFAGNVRKEPHQYWVPLIALFTGCRLEEICQLHLDDLRQEGGVWVFDINGKNEKRLKNLSSVRLVPIHPQLIALGLLEYAEQLRRRGEVRLFPMLHQRRDGYGSPVSKWFQRYRKRCGVGLGKTFHSFRHTFITHMKHKQVDPFMIHELDGHAIGSETMGRYGKRYTPEILLREAIEKIDYALELPRAYPMK